MRSEKNGICVIARANKTGLGYMSKDFIEAMRPERVVTINVGGDLEFCPWWYEGFDGYFCSVKEWRDSSQTLIENALDGMKYVVGFETFYNSSVLEVARLEGVKAIGLPMWECSPSYMRQCDQLICLSDQDLAFYGRGHRVNWPAADSLRRKPREELLPPRLFVHNAGHSDHGRNGTREVLAAAKYLEGTPAALWINAQFEIPEDWMPSRYLPFQCSTPGGMNERADLFDCVDCFVHPMQFPGLSLPLVEAAASRIPTIVLDLPEWQDWPHRVSVGSTYGRRFAVPVTMHRADVDALGKMMRGMALGEILLKLPPAPPTWDDFRGWWHSNIDRR